MLCRLKTNHFLEKENLLNIGIKKLMKEYKYVGWLDSDIIFQDDN